MDNNAPTKLVAEAERLTEKIIKQVKKSPTLRASIYNRCLESLGWIQEQSWEATDAKWTKILATEQEDNERLRGELVCIRDENKRLRAVIDAMRDRKW